MRKEIIAFWDRDDSLTLFLWSLVLLVFIVGPVSRFDAQYKIVVEIFFSVVLVAGVWATIFSTRIAIVTALFALLAIGTAAAAVVTPSNETLRIISNICEAPPLALILFVVVKQTLKDGPITEDRVKGAIAAYLLLGLLWAKLYIIVELLHPNSFTGIAHADPMDSLIYFSFVTLTTVGYGDIVPTYEISRSLANAEALIGQLFPAIFIARIVTLQVENRRRS